MTEVVARKKHPCPNEHCGNTLYASTYEYSPVSKETPHETKFSPVWRCTNCQRTYPRHMRNRPTNQARAMANWNAIRDAWKETDARLHKLIEEGTPSGCLLVHGRSFDHHLNALLMGEGKPAKWSTWHVKYHTQEAWANLERAKQFVNAASKTDKDTL